MPHALTELNLTELNLAGRRRRNARPWPCFRFVAAPGQRPRWAARR